jgi:hypothetical protein
MLSLFSNQLNSPLANLDSHILQLDSSCSLEHLQPYMVYNKYFSCNCNLHQSHNSDQHEYLKYGRLEWEILHWELDEWYLA